MAPSFGRSISFPLSAARSSSSAGRRHVRSVSLPSSRTHPLLAHLHNTVRAVRDWAAQPNAAAPSTGLAHLDALHAALAELLLLPEARAALRAGSATADCLLDGFLALADAYAAFQEALLGLKSHAAEAQAALRRRDAARLASAVRAQRQADKDVARLAASVRAACRSPCIGAAAEVEVSGMLAEALAAVAFASAAVFTAVESVSSAATSSAAAAASSSKKSIISVVVKRTTTDTTKTSSSDDALQRLEHLDECVAEIQAGTDKVFRSILHTRVALLNIQTQTC